MRRPLFWTASDKRAAAPREVPEEGEGGGAIEVLFWARSILVGVASTIWSVAGVTLIPAIGWGLLGRKLGGSANRGTRLTVAGALGLNLSSKTAADGRPRAILDGRWVCRLDIWSEYFIRTDEGVCPLRSLVRFPKHSTGIVGTGN